MGRYVEGEIFHNVYDLATSFALPHCKYCSVQAGIFLAVLSVSGKGMSTR